MTDEELFALCTETEDMIGQTKLDGHEHPVIIVAPIRRAFAVTRRLIAAVRARADLAPAIESAPSAADPDGPIAAPAPPPTPPRVVTFTMDGLATVNITNKREDWKKRARRTDKHVDIGYYETLAALQARPMVPPLAVHFLRTGPTRMDSDGVTASVKALRDGVALALGINDGDPRITWTSDREIGPHAVKVTIREVR